MEEGEFVGGNEIPLIQQTLNLLEKHQLFFSYWWWEAIHQRFRSLFLPSTRPFVRISPICKNTEGGLGVLPADSERIVPDQLLLPKPQMSGHLLAERLPSNVTQNVTYISTATIFCCMNIGYNGCFRIRAYRSSSKAIWMVCVWHRSYRVFCSMRLCVYLNSWIETKCKFLACQADR